MKPLQLLLVGFCGVVSGFNWVQDDQGGRFHVELFRDKQFDVVSRRKLSENTSDPAVVLDFEEVPLGVGLGTHYAELHFGIPTQKASVIVDTGSHLTAMPCKSCVGCGDHTDPPYDLSLSTTVEYLGCDAYGECKSCDDNKCYVSLSYSEGSMWRAVLVEDLCWLGPLDEKDSDDLMRTFGVRFPIGCQIKETDNSNSILNYLVKAQRIQHNVFTMCFGLQGGNMAVGGIDKRFHTSKLQYMPYSKGSNGWYTIQFRDIKVGNISIGVESDIYNRGKGVIVDSGTTDTFFPRQAKTKFYEMYKKVSGRDFVDSDFSASELSDEEMQELPDISLELGEKSGETITLTIPATQYMTLQSNGKWVGNFHFSEYSGSILGASTMVNHNIVFDRENSKLGFARANCDSGVHNSISKNATREYLQQHRIVVVMVFGFAATCLLLVAVTMMLRRGRGVQWSSLRLNRQPNEVESSELEGLAHHESTRSQTTSTDMFTIDDEESDGDIETV